MANLKEPGGASTSALARRFEVGKTNKARRHAGRDVPHYSFFDPRSSLQQDYFAGGAAAGAGAGGGGGVTGIASPRWHVAHATFAI